MAVNKIYFSNLRAEMSRSQLTIQDMARLLNYNRDTLGKKLARKTKINLDEAFKIQEKFFPNQELEYLFKELLDPPNKTA